MGKLMAVDLGTKRVGLALTDPLKLISTPHSIIGFTTMESLVRDIRKIVTEQSVEKVIIGLPIREDGAEGPGCIASKRLASLLAAENIESVLWDERYSSKIAEYYLRECGIRHKDTRDKLDSVSASVLLESYLQSLPR